MTRANQSKQKEKEKSAATELSAFSLAAAISEARQQQQQQPKQQQPRRIFPPATRIFPSAFSPKASASQQSIATNTSFATAHESAQPTNELTTPAASYFADSSDDETDDQGLTFDNDPLTVLSRTDSGTPKEISFSSKNPEETMPSKKSSKAKMPAPTVESTPVAPPKTETAVVAKKEDEPHFDVAQNVYGAAKDVWAWGKTVPVVSNFLGATEFVAAKVLDTAVHMDLPAIDEQAVKPNLKKLDDIVVTPAIVAVWNIIAPAVMKTEEMVVKPVLTEVVPRVLAPLGMFDKKEEEMKKKEEEKKSMIDASPTPEVVPALN